MISSEPQNILLPNLVWWCCRMKQSVTRNKNCLLSSWSRSQRGLILSKYYSDYCIFWTADSLATKLCPMIGYHRPERLVEKVDYCLQGQSHSEGSKCRCLSRWYFLNRQTFCTKLGIVMHHNELECHAKKKSFAIFKVKVTARARMIKIWEFCTVSSKLLILLLQNFVW